MKGVHTAILAATALALGGCATVLNGTKQDYKVATNPQGASVKFSNGEECVSPCELELRRGNDLRADISLDGYKPEYVLVQSRLGGSTFGNILLGGVIGGVVDGSNGASNHLYPKPLSVKLVAEGSSEEALLLDDDGKTISTLREHNDKVREDVAKSIGNELAEYTPAPEDAAAAKEEGDSQ